MPLRSCSPSASARWGQCPRSLALAELVGASPPSVHSARGHVLHAAVAEMMVHNTSAAAAYTAALYENQEENDATGYAYRAEDIDTLEFAIHQAREIVGPAQVEVEARLPPPNWLPMRRGPTLDVVFLEGDRVGVIDYKFGKHVIPPDDPQLLIYADTLRANAPIGKRPIELWLVQPPNKPTSFIATREILQERLEPYVMAAIEAQVMEVSDDPADYRKGSWCHFCPGKAICPLHRRDRHAKVFSMFSELIEKD